MGKNMAIINHQLLPSFTIISRQLSPLTIIISYIVYDLFNHLPSLTIINH